MEDLEWKERAIKAQSLTTDTSILTSIGNDYNFENIFKRQIEALGNKGDALLQCLQVETLKILLI